MSAGSRAAGRPDARQDLRGDLGVGHRQGRRAAAGLSLPRRRQRGDDARRRVAGGRLADGDQPGRRAGAPRDGRLVRLRGARPRGVRRGPIPRPADRVRVAVGDPRRRLTLAVASPDRRLPVGRSQLETVERERWRDDGSDKRPGTQRPRRHPRAPRDDGLDDGHAGGRHIAAEQPDRDPGVALGPRPELEVVTGRPTPDLVDVQPVPVRPIAGGEEEEDRATGRPAAPAGRRLPRLDIRAAFRRGPHPEPLGEVRGVGHPLRVSAAATANPAAVASPTILVLSASCAAGRRSEASSVRIAPAANASMKAMTSPAAPANRPYPTAAAAALAIATSVQIPTTQCAGRPAACILADEEAASGTFEIKIATSTATLGPAPPTSDSPRTIDSGMPSRTAPSRISRPPLPGIRSMSSSPTK